MQNLIILKVLLLVFSIIFTSQSLAADRILPLPKPSIDEKTKTKTAKKKEIYPQKKPKKKSEEITKQLLATGILIRQLHSYKLPNCLRISIGTKNEMEAVINSLRQMK